MWKNVHPVCSAGIWTHNLWNTILPTITTRPELLPQRYKPSYNAPYVNSYRNPIPMCGVITSLLNVYKAVPMYGRVFFSWSVLVARATTFTKAAATMMRKKEQKVISKLISPLPLRVTRYGCVCQWERERVSGWERERERGKSRKWGMIAFQLNCFILTPPPLPTHTRSVCPPQRGFVRAIR